MAREEVIAEANREFGQSPHEDLMRLECRDGNRISASGCDGGDDKSLQHDVVVSAGQMAPLMDVIWVSVCPNAPYAGIVL